MFHRCHLRRGDRGRAGPNRLRWLALLPLLLATAPALAKDDLGVFGQWAAFRDADVPRCYAISAAERGASAFPAYADVATWPRLGVRGQVHFRLSRELHDNPRLTLTIGSERFQLTGGSVDAGRDIYAGVRAGVKATPDILLYAKGGYTNARYNYIGTDGTTNYDRNIDTDGWRVGAGIEHKFGSTTFGKLEYRYSNYSRAEIDFEAAGIPDSDRFAIDNDRHQVVASVGVRF
jgi:hypothetical protein